MKTYTFVTGYKHNDQLRNSFNQLAKSTFGISFEDWYDNGYWTEKYVPFSFVDKGKIIANVSVNKLDLIIMGEKKRGLQIGTVMTHPEYRNQGLSRRLMNKVLEEYEDQYDIMYLFANQSVLDFYPKFGFNRVEEHLFSMEVSVKPEPAKLHKLNIKDNKDLTFIYNFANERIPVSTYFATENTSELLMFYCLYVFREDIYYLEDEETLLIFKSKKDELHIFDTISKKKVNIKKIIPKIATQDISKVIFHYTPEDITIKTIENREEDDVLFVKCKGIYHLPKVKHPITSHA